MTLFFWSLLCYTSAFGGVSTIATYTCSLLGNFEPSFLSDGDFIIGGLFPIHYRVDMVDWNYTQKPSNAQCMGIDPRSFRWAQTMRFAVEEINQNPNLLPNFTLGYKIYESCATHIAGQRAVMGILNGPEKAQNLICSGASPVLGIIGDSGSSQTIIVSKTVEPFKIPVISYFSTCSCLSDKEKFPTFFRFIPNDDYQVKAIAQLLQRFGWTWVGMISEDDDYGRSALQGLLREFESTSTCLAYYEMIPKVYNQNRIQEILNVMKKSTANVVIAFGGEGALHPFLKAYAEQNITRLQWIASASWVTATLFLGSKFYPYLAGTMGFGIHLGKVPGLIEYLLSVNPMKYSSNLLVHELWGALYGCSFSPLGRQSQIFPIMPNCTGSEPINDQYSSYLNASNLGVSYNVYKAVYAFAHALHDLINCKPGKGPFQRSSCADTRNIHPWQIQYYLKQISFIISGEEVAFNENGDSVPSYDLINWQRSATEKLYIVNVGMFNGSREPGMELVVKEDAIVWGGNANQAVVSVCSSSCVPGYRKAVRHGQPLCCFDCVPCDDGNVNNSTDAVDCSSCSTGYWSNKARTECLPKAVEFLAYDSMGQALAALSVVGACLTIAVLAIFIRHRNTPIVRLNNLELSYFILLSLTLCFLCALVFIGEPTMWSCMLRHTAFSITFSLCISCILGKTLVVLAAFTATRPGTNIMKWLGPKQQRVIIFACTSTQVIVCTIWLLAAPPFPLRNTQYDRSKIILECSVGSSLAFWCVLGYIGLLACLCFVLAFLARQLPGNFNEAKFITFSMLIFCAVWLAFIPAYVSSPGKFTVAVEIFAILASSYALLVCLFAPKCYIIILNPQKNTKQHLMGRIKM